MSEKKSPIRGKDKERRTRGQMCHFGTRVGDFFAGAITVPCEAVKKSSEK